MSPGVPYISKNLFLGSEQFSNLTNYLPIFLIKRMDKIKKEMKKPENITFQYHEEFNFQTEHWTTYSGSAKQNSILAIRPSNKINSETTTKNAKHAAQICYLMAAFQCTLSLPQCFFLQSFG